MSHSGRLGSNAKHILRILLQITDKDDEDVEVDVETLEPVTALMSR